MAIAIGPLYVRRALYIDKQPASIWQKLETLSGLNNWFGIGHTIDSFVRGANGSIELSVDIDNVRARFGGPTLCWQPGSEWSYQNNWLDEDSPWIWEHSVSCCITDSSGWAPTLANSYKRTKMVGTPDTYLPCAESARPDKC